MRPGWGTGLTAEWAALLCSAAVSLAAAAEPVPGGLGPLPPVSIPADNPMSAAKVELGRILFWDTRLSGNASTSCASCHAPQTGWGETVLGWRCRQP